MMVGKRVDVAASRRLIADTTSGNRPDVKARHAKQRENNPSLPDDSTMPETSDSSNDDAPAPGSRADWESERVKEVVLALQIERQKIEGALLPVEAVNYWIDDIGATLVGLLENLPARLTPILRPMKNADEIHAAITEAADEILGEMKDKMKRCTTPGKSR